MKRNKSIPFSRPLEERIDVPYYVVGTPEWLATALEPDALPAGKVIRVRSSKDLASVHAWLRTQSIHGLDSESSGSSKRDGLDPVSETSKMVLFQYGTQERVYVIEPQLVPEFREELESDQFLHLGQNLVHDFKFILYKYGVHLVRMCDTMLMEQLVTAGLAGARVGLADICRKYPPHHLISKEVRNEFIVADGSPLSRRAVEYAAKDVWLLFDAMKAQTSRVKELKMELVAQDEFDCIPITAEMELTGVHVDERILRLAILPYQQRAEQIQAEVMELYNTELQKKGGKQNILLPELPEIFDLDSNAQKLEALQELGFDVNDVQRDTLKEIPHKIAGLLAEYSECMKVVSTYGENLLQRISKTTGRLHPEFNQLGAGELDARQGRATKTTIATGRYSGDMQQLPRPKLRYEPVTSEQLELVNMLFADRLAELNQTLIAVGA